MTSSAQLLGALQELANAKQIDRNELLDLLRTTFARLDWAWVLFALPLYFVPGVGCQNDVRRTRSSRSVRDSMCSSMWSQPV